MSVTLNNQLADEMSTYALIESAQNLAIAATHLLEVAVDLAENSGADLKLNSVIRAALRYVSEVADLTERAELITLRDRAQHQSQQAGSAA